MLPLTDKQGNRLKLPEKSHLTVRICYERHRDVRKYKMNIIQQTIALVYAAYMSMKAYEDS